jgi:hypothetical protein
MPGRTVRIDGRGVRRELPGGKAGHVPWDDLTTGDDPFAGGVSFVPAGGDVRQPSAATAAHPRGGWDSPLAN